MQQSQNSYSPSLGYEAMRQHSTTEKKQYSFKGSSSPFSDPSSLQPLKKAFKVMKSLAASAIRISDSVSYLQIVSGILQNLA